MGAWKARNEVQAEKEAETPVSAEAPTTSDAPAVEVTPAPVASSDETSTQPDTHPSAPTPSASLRPIQVTISGPEPSDESPAEEEEPSNFTTAIATPVDPPAQDVSVPVSVPIAIPDIAAPIEPSTNHAAPSASAEQQDNPADVAVAPEPASIPEQSEQLDTPKPTTPNPTTDGPQLDTFLLPASPVFHSPSGPSPAHSDSDKGDAVVVGEPQDSDWSEVDA
ncbi:hypothetical protein PLICRDRAFT_36705 [Plicaturopsis crispa FD-325 SS-3]|nr:hypothetical protein PLICRDRAFT_36705 [Plicaturopsis crispa FD-325 SS-3]